MEAPQKPDLNKNFPDTTKNSQNIYSTRNISDALQSTLKSAQHFLCAQ